MSDIKPLVSIIVPVYNVEKYLKKCVDSLISQTYKNMEIILVDDGSTDESGKICDNCKEKDSRVKVIHKGNGGQSFARQSGLESADGQYLMFVDGDDYIDSETVCECIDATIKEPDVDCVLFSYAKETLSDTVPMHILDSSTVFSGTQARDMIHRRLFGLLSSELNHPERMENMVSCCMKLYRTDIAKKGRFFDIEEIGTCEDGLFNIFALQNCKKIIYIDKCFYHYVKRTESSVATCKPNLANQWENLFGIMREFIAENNLGSNYTEALNNRVAMSVVGVSFNILGNNELSAIKKIKEIGKYLKREDYRKAVKNMDTTMLPPLWKILILFSKARLSVGVYLGISFLRKIITARR